MRSSTRASAGFGGEGLGCIAVGLLGGLSWFVWEGTGHNLVLALGLVVGVPIALYGFVLLVRRSNEQAWIAQIESRNATFVIFGSMVTMSGIPDGNPPFEHGQSVLAYVSADSLYFTDTSRWVELPKPFAFVDETRGWGGTAQVSFSGRHWMCTLDVGVPWNPGQTSANVDIEGRVEFARQAIASSNER